MEMNYLILIACWQVIAAHLSVEEVAGIKEAFDMMDAGKKGKINMEELKGGLHKLGHQIADADLQILMEAVSVDHCRVPKYTLIFVCAFLVLITFKPIYAVIRLQWPFSICLCITFIFEVRSSSLFVNNSDCYLFISLQALGHDGPSHITIM